MLARFSAIFASLIAVSMVLAEPITYQGQLTQSGTPANGAFDLRFRLYDQSLGGGQIGPQVCLDDIVLADGRFSVQLDFGDAFNGNVRYLEVDTRPGAGVTCVSSAGFTTLGPRQPLTQAPQAAFAAKSGDAFLFAGLPPAYFANASNLTGGTLNPALLPAAAARRDLANTFLSANTFSNTTTFNSFVGIGGSFAHSGADRFRISNNPGSPGYIGMYITTDSPAGLPFYGMASLSNSVWTYLSTDGQWRLYQTGDRLTVTPDGRVGVNTNSPQATLDVRGEIVLGTTGALQVHAGPERITTIRGRVLQSGAVFYGSGFTSTRISAGYYRVTFTTPFAGTPTVIANAMGTSARIVTIIGVSASLVDINVYNTAGTIIDADVMFEASGPR